MIATDYDFEMQRLNESFKNFYSKAKRQVIAGIVAELPGSYFSKCIDKAMWLDRPPKIDWFHEIVSYYRKKQDAKSTLEHMHASENSCFTSQDISMMKEYAFRRMDGKLTDREFHDFLQTISKIILSGHPEIKCSTCLDHGAYVPYMGNGIERCPNGCKYYFENQSESH